MMASPAAAAASRDDWIADGYGPANTSYNPYERRITADTVTALRPRWRIKVAPMPESCTETSAPVLAAGRLFLTDYRGFGAYRVATGDPLWRVDFPGPREATTPALVVAGGILLAAVTDCTSVSVPDGRLTAYDMATGRRLWSAHRTAPMGWMVVDHGVVAVS